MSKIIECINLTKVYRKGDIITKVFENIELNISRGDFIAIMGTSGVGKSTLISILGLLDTNFEGEYYFNQRDVRKMNDDQLSEHRNQDIGFIFQDFNLIDEYTVRENVLLPHLYNHQQQESTNIERLAQQMGMYEKLDAYPKNLSGGQKQRVAIMRALIHNPKLIIADEPTGALDEMTRNEILNILVTLHKEGRTILLVTHDLEVAKCSTKILELKAGTLSEKLGIQHAKI
ncbi:ABC transporter ATP-binding protein [Staphylococcus canis]|uniref:ABC transporter ATP-binding protein n=1 Tax=Staphylococcus canis TaxID=2724942 RepID=A0ABS0TBE0_9STAP|nr:ABC transporter ATP-binding protein [Staphylococcus canis]MBI5975276.1 ABC transporter ATP-binding protein [Staphylococcus canis]